MSSRDEIRALVPRATLDVAGAMRDVQEIIEQVRSGGVPTLLDLGEKFDGVRPPAVRVSSSQISESLNGLDPKVRDALLLSIARIKKVHQEQLRSDKTVTVIPGGTVTERWVPVDRVGLYVPGGRAVYPSSVMMNVIPAQIAGVQSIAVASPPQKEFGGLPHPTILATCALLGIDEVYAVGGAQAVAMFAYGVGCQAVDMVTGPGNVYVAAAKRALRGIIGIDSEAGPTEIIILADETANPDFVAADLISQAEHDTIAAAVLVTPSRSLADQVKERLRIRVSQTKHSERIATALSGIQSAIVIVKDVEQGLQVLNGYAGEHVQIHTRDAQEVATKVRNGGAIFIGSFAPVSLGDYSAGSNHVLPTGGCACHSSGLSVQTFLKGLHFVDYSSQALESVADTVITLANSEDLPAHGEAIAARFRS
ncbi:MAG: histidinol dehydrogenase [Candidatus Nanopelagicaceae bacterium]